MTPIPQLYVLSKYPCTIDHDLRQCQDVNKLETQEQRNIFVRSSSNDIDCVQCKISTLPLLHKHRHTFDTLHSLFPRHSLPVVLQTTVEGGDDLGMRICEMYASGNK